MTPETQATAIDLKGALTPEQQDILSPEALAFLALLAREFAPRVTERLATRRERQARRDAGEPLDFLPETAEIRNAAWRVAAIPADLLDRRVEITGPVDRKMIINALNSGANVFMADFEDSNAPTWSNVLDGQLNLRDAVRGTITWTDPTTGRHYALAPKTAVLMVRPRGWHLQEKHLVIDGAPVPAALFDFGLYFFHNALALLGRGTAPYVYLPKLESHLEARLWNDVFVRAQEELGIPQGTIRATVLIETLPAAFEMDEILFELRAHSAGLNCGRWDYIFSTIKTLGRRPGFLLPDRGQVTMTQPFLHAYSRLLIRTCHRRGIHAMGGMAAQIPIRNDEAANTAALERVRADKKREVGDGHDGTWVAHPGLVSLAKEIFDAGMPGPNQIETLRPDIDVTAADLTALPAGTRTEAGLRQNVNVGVLYLEAWLRGQGCVPLYNLMEDAATAEISRTQVWQWIRQAATLEDGRTVTVALFREILEEEMAAIRTMVGDAAFAAGRFRTARRLFDELITAPELSDFLTLSAYDALIESES